MNNFFIKLKKGSKIVFNKDTEICVTKYGENTIITLKNNSCDIVIQNWQKIEEVLLWAMQYLWV